jgi:transcriptional regulator with XRE-family HTH domain
MSTEDKSEAMGFLESLTGGPLTLGELLLSIRQSAALSQKETATRLGISRSHLCDLEKGRKTLSPERAARYARNIGYSEAQFVRLAEQAMVEEAGLPFKVQLAPAAA